MSYLFELRVGAGKPGYVITDGVNREEALERLHMQLDTDEDEEVVVLAVHIVH